MVAFLDIAENGRSSIAIIRTHSYLSDKKMGAAGSVMTSSENEDRDQSNVEDPPSKTARVSESLNMKSKFPSFAQPSKSDTPSSAATIFKVTIAFEIPFIRELQLFETYLLRLSMESLDIIVEGEID